ncbi:transcriptional repressor LexA [uncultured Acetobacterium sp.]|uniref:transcriptional repressor LexA n=1 Tax=uncultured Acetobacterium sp. TaxID=217139 RepID=UPI00242274B3|nr:transcriptional repressor LexA [uncultured Acetobacterium sp.]MBU4540025.1 transcriptional repressor LexA [Bacillota bacterium]MDP2843709.1 transcriptional repressor LexA [Acetobacterium sp.]
MYEDLNSKQIDILKFIDSQMRDKRYPPSVREICAAVSLKSTSTAHSYLKKLEELGYIKRDSTKTRAIEVLRHDPNETISNYFDEKIIVSLPILGCVTAGAPILAIENITDIFPLPLDFAGTEAAFILEVKGTSMIDAGILDGDKIIVKKQESANNNDIVVVLLLEDNEATVKRIFYEEPNKVRLQPDNKSMDPIICKEQDIKILGKVTGLMRKY